MNMQFSFTSGRFPVWFILIAAPTLEQFGRNEFDRRQAGLRREAGISH